VHSKQPLSTARRNAYFGVTEAVGVLRALDTSALCWVCAGMVVHFPSGCVAGINTKSRDRDRDRDRDCAFPCVGMYFFKVSQETPTSHVLQKKCGPGRQLWTGMRVCVTASCSTFCKGP
jgi:hypothetical protein